MWIALVEERRLRCGKVTRMEVQDLPSVLMVIASGAVLWHGHMVVGDCAVRVRKTCVTFSR
jgi:hypothetical protein